MRVRSLSVAGLALRHEEENATRQAEILPQTGGLRRKMEGEGGARVELMGGAFEGPAEGLHNVVRGFPSDSRVQRVWRVQRLKQTAIARDYNSGLPGLLSKTD